MTSSVLSCKKNKTEYDLDEENRDLVSQNLVKKGIKHSWDDLDYKFTYQYQSFLDNDKQIISHPLLEDIYKKDNVFYLKVRCGFVKTFYFNLEVENSDLLKKVLDDFNKEQDYLMNGVLVVKINKLQKIPLIAKPYCEVFEGELEYSLIELEANESFFGEGKLINIKSL